MKVKQEDGTEIEVFSQEEADQRAAEAAEAARKEAQEAAELEKAELAEKLKKFEDKEYNFSQLRKKKEKEEGKDDELINKVTGLTQEVENLKKQPFEKAKSDFIASNGIEGDKELKEKFDHFYAPLAATAKSEADHKAALAGAFAAATGGSRQPDFSGMMVSTRVTPPSNGGNKSSEAGRHFANVFGNTPTDLEKYGKK